jgi:hypothetical protein
LRLPLVSETAVGKISNACLLISIAAYALFFAFVASGQRGGSAFYSNLFLALPVTVAAVCGTAAAVFAIAEVVRRRGTSVVALVSIAYGTLIVLFVIAELAQPH